MTTELVACPRCHGCGGGSDAAGYKPFKPGVYFGQGDWVDCDMCDGKTNMELVTTIETKRFLRWLRISQVRYEYRKVTKQGLQCYRDSGLADALGSFGEDINLGPVVNVVYSRRYIHFKDSQLPLRTFK